MLHEPTALRVARATNHARNTLLAGFTTVRDLGTEGAGYSDVGLKRAIEQGIIPGPRMIVVTRAIVATGSYGPKAFAPDIDLPQGAEEADGMEGLTRVVRDQIGQRRRLDQGVRRLSLGAERGERARRSPSRSSRTSWRSRAAAGGRSRRTRARRRGCAGRLLAGVETIEHGDAGTPEVFRLMAEKGDRALPHRRRRRRDSLVPGLEARR